MSPRLTVGLIIYNGAGSARRCIDSLLAQSFGDFELLIHDNASTDGTSDICAEYAAADPRVRHVRHPETVPQSENFRGVLMTARSEYFMWAADDDIWHPRFAELCIAELDRHPKAVAACTRVMFRYPDGTERPSRSTHAITGTPRERVVGYLANPRDSARLYSVFRTPALQASYPTGITMFGYDWLIVALTMLHGDHLEVDEFGLLRSGHAEGKYFERYTRHFVREKGLLGRLSYLLPMLPMTRELNRHLPPDVRRAAALRLLRLNLLQTLLLLKWKYPAFNKVFNLARSLDRALGVA